MIVKNWRYIMIERLFAKPKVYHYTKDNLYHEYNQWGPDDFDKNWFVRFLRFHFPNNVERINFFGPLSLPFFICNKFEGKKVFYTAEDVEHKFTKLNLYYGDYRLKYVDFAMGFGKHDSEKYLRFPYWILTTFNPCSTEDDIVKRVQEINHLRFDKQDECVLVNKHDKKGTRNMIYQDIKSILNVKLAGTWNNNTDELWTKYNNDKMLYVKRFKFNICPENDNTRYYVTEKLFDAFLCGCIPLYYGSFNDPEPGLINKDSVIFWNDNRNNSKNIELVRELNTNIKLYNEFIAQTKLTDRATEYVIDRFMKLKEHMQMLIKE